MDIRHDYSHNAAEFSTKSLQPTDQPCEWIIMAPATILLFFDLVGKSKASRMNTCGLMGSVCNKKLSTVRKKSFNFMSREKNNYRQTIAHWHTGLYISVWTWQNVDSGIRYLGGGGGGGAMATNQWAGSPGSDLTTPGSPGSAVELQSGWGLAKVSFLACFRKDCALKCGQDCSRLLDFWGAGLSSVEASESSAVTGHGKTS